ncbi:MAG TPA: phosphatidylglycerophosphatase A [Vicinamibacteria bacterium]|nr:phosphatidylglycerophosphatase A [Vicinamibacteria bacterium]
MSPGTGDRAGRAVAAPRPNGVAALVATGLGAGYSPVAPGTAGSLVGLALFWPLSGLAVSVQLAALAALFLVAVVSSRTLAAAVGRKDPAVVVVDEVAGMWTTLLFLPFTPVVAALAFLAFRAMDVVKPWPARQLEALPGGWGIVCDDMMAGVYANLLVHLALRAWA